MPAVAKWCTVFWQQRTRASQGRGLISLWTIRLSVCWACGGVGGEEHAELVTSVGDRLWVVVLRPRRCSDIHTGQKLRRGMELGVPCRCEDGARDVKLPAGAGARRAVAQSR